MRPFLSHGSLLLPADRQDGKALYFDGRIASRTCSCITTGAFPTKRLATRTKPPPTSPRPGSRPPAPGQRPKMRRIVRRLSKQDPLSPRLGHLFASCPLRLGDWQRYAGHRTDSHKPLSPAGAYVVLCVPGARGFQESLTLCLPHLFSRPTRS